MSSSPPVPYCSSAVADETNCNDVPEKRKNAVESENTMRAPSVSKKQGKKCCARHFPSGIRNHNLVEINVCFLISASCVRL